MNSIAYKVIATGSKGNAVLINKYILIDIGVPFTKIKEHFKDIKIVLLTHEHSDHFCKSTIKKLAKERPTVRFACGSYLVKKLLECEVSKTNIDVLKAGKIYDYGSFKISPVVLYHDVPNYGYRLFIGERKVFYATDTFTLEGIVAKNYDLYFVESNYNEAETLARIEEKEKNGQYIYEYRAMKNHLSDAKTSEFLLENMNDKSQYVLLHQHED